MSDVLPILYQDEHLVAINKPSGLLVHKSPIDKHETRFAMQMLRDQLGQWVYPIHRLDRPTSGVLLFALSSDTASKVCANWQEQAQKTYLAIVRGWAPQEVTVDHPLKERLDKIADKHAKQDKPAQEAVTKVTRLATIELENPVDRYPTSRYSLVECQPKTGRKHQLRRHLKHINHPIIGDAKHGKSIHNRFFQTAFNAHRLLLHAHRLCFNHPVTQQPLAITAPLDETMNHLLHEFGWQRAAGTTDIEAPHALG
ncbi:tRNA pseudouridine(65) synthase TruC [Halioxenophilus aromaticivorans]|uniref:tRNA pseudouridine synthase C n=1 Tax=Halioxenophilus aromaticivorans TaxID=1306992 RepID=A0AAV3UAI3_9ALTE